MRHRTGQTRFRWSFVLVALTSLILAAILLTSAIVSHGSLVGARDAGALASVLLAFLIFVLSAIVLVFRPEQRTLRHLQWTSHMSAVAIFLAFGGILYLVASEVRTEPGIGIAVTDQADVDVVLEPAIEGAVASPAGPAYFVPTGVGEFQGSSHHSTNGWSDGWSRTAQGL